MKSINIKQAQDIIELYHGTDRSSILHDLVIEDSILGDGSVEMVYGFYFESKKEAELYRNALHIAVEFFLINKDLTKKANF